MPPLIEANEPPSLETLTMRPQALRSIRGTARLQHRHAPNRFVSKPCWTTEVGVHPALPGVVVDRRVVHQDIQPAVSLLHSPEAALDAGIVGDVEPTELRAELVGGRAPLLVVACRQDRSETVLDQLPHDLATDPPIRTRNKSDSTLVRHRPSRSHPQRLRPGACLGNAREGPSSRLTDTSATRSALASARG